MIAFLFKVRGFNLANRDVHHPLWKVQLWRLSNFRMRMLEQKIDPSEMRQWQMTCRAGKRVGPEVLAEENPCKDWRAGAHRES
jgi:hypothetical protein